MSTYSYQISLAKKSDKKALLRFYRQQSYSSGLLGFDTCYLAKQNDEIIGAAITSKLTKDNPTPLLHGLVISKTYQNQGIAKKLLAFIQKDTKQQLVEKIIAFCQPELVTFYQKLNFAEASSEQLPEQLHKRFQSYQKKYKHLQVMSWQTD